jgi:hypothetical protein
MRILAESCALAVVAAAIAMVRARLTLRTGLDFMNYSGREGTLDLRPPSS